MTLWPWLVTRGPAGRLISLPDSPGLDRLKRLYGFPCLPYPLPPSILPVPIHASTQWDAHPHPAPTPQHTCVHTHLIDVSYQALYADTLLWLHTRAHTQARLLPRQPSSLLLLQDPGAPPCLAPPLQGLAAPGPDFSIEALQSGFSSTLLKLQFVDNLAASLPPGERLQATLERVMEGLQVAPHPSLCRVSTNPAGPCAIDCMVPGVSLSSTLHVPPVVTSSCLYTCRSSSEPFPC